MVNITPEELEDIKASLSTLLQKAESEDKAIRYNIIREAKRNDLFWHGFQHIFWDNGSGDWRIPTHDDLKSTPFIGEEASFIYDYVINITKAHGESIIAALSAEVPSVRFKPFDPDKSTDILAARTGNNAAEKVTQDNLLKVTFTHALFLMYTSHLLAGYTYSADDEESPKIKVPTYGKVDKTVVNSQCGTCGYNEQQTYNPSEYAAPTDPTACPGCMGPEGPSGYLTDTPETKQVVDKIGEEDKPRSKQCVEIYGVLNVKVPYYVLKQKDFGYLIHYGEEHYSNVRSEAPPEMWDKITPNSSDVNEKYMRTPSFTAQSYFSSNDLTTVKRVWFRKTWFNCLEKEKSDQLLKYFPDGAMIKFINKDDIVKYDNECMDNHWKVTKPGLSRFSHADPICTPVIPLQELKNNAENYMVQSLEYSVPSDFADPRVLDFDAYRSSENSPGQTYPASTQQVGNRPMSEFFYTTKSATMPKEGGEFLSHVDDQAQFVLGDFPSVHGGPSQGASKTLGEYTQSREYALQRLSIPYMILSIWWAELMHIAVKGYVKSLEVDDFFTKKKPGGFQKVWLKKSESEGDFNVIYPESSDKFPTSQAQRIGMLMQFIQLNNPDIFTTLFSPLNARTVTDTLGADFIKFPHEAQALKQYREIEMMLDAAAIDMGNGEFQTTVPIEPEIDDNEVHLLITADWLCSDEAQDIKLTNPDVYMNVLQHHRMHFMDQQAQMMQQQAQQQLPQGDNNGKRSTENVPQ